MVIPQAPGKPLYCFHISGCNGLKLSMRVSVSSLLLVFTVLGLPACQLLPEGPEPADHQLRCGERELGYSLAGDRVELHVNDEVRELEPAETASGALYQDPDGGTEFWSKGERVTVTLDGERLPECQHREQASLEAHRWQAVSVEGGPVNEEARPVTLDFMAEGRVAGRSGCNHYTATWVRVGDRLIIEQPVSTRMACPPSIMAVEKRFLAALSRIEAVRAGEEEGLEFLGREGDRLIRVEKWREGGSQ